jgi:hypothetical protein
VVANIAADVVNRFLAKRGNGGGSPGQGGYG